MSEPGRYNLRVYQGSTFDEALEFKNEDLTPRNLSGLSARMQVRESIESPVVIMELTTDNGMLEIVAPEADGVLQFNISAEDTADLDIGHDYAVWVYDLEFFVTLSGYVDRAVQGNFIIFPEVTRA